MLRLGSIVSNIPIPEVIKKRVISYLLKRYVGQFLQKQLSLDQLTIEIISGTGIFRDLALSVEALNETAEQINLPFKFIEGYIAEICISIPWKALLTENCFVEVTGLVLTLHPKLRVEDISVVDSMINSMTSSMQIAQECLCHVESQDGANLSDIGDLYSDFPDSKASEFDAGLDSSGLKRFALAIDTILSRIKVRFVDSIIRLENAPKSGLSGIALEFRINKIDYFDEAGLEQSETQNVLTTDYFTAKKVLAEGISIYTDEFILSKVLRSVSELGLDVNNVIDIHKNETKFDKDINTSIDFSYLNDETRKLHFMEDENMRNLGPSNCEGELILCAKLYGCQEIKMKIKQNDTVCGPKVQLEANCGSLMAFFSPRQIYLLKEFCDGFLFPEEENPFSVKENDSKEKPMSQNDFQTVEHELLKHLTPPDRVLSHALGQAEEEGWSSPPDIFANDEFLPVNPSLSYQKNIELTSSVTSEISELESSYSSSIAGHTIKGSSSASNSKINDNEILMSFKVRFNSLGLLILHEDILLPSSDKSEVLTLSSVGEMKTKSKEFFTCVGNIWHSENNYREFRDLRDKLNESCSLSHIRIISTPVIVEGMEKTLSNKWERNTKCTVGWCEIIENLYTNGFAVVSCELLAFQGTDPKPNCQFALPQKPKAQIYINQSQTSKKAGRSRRLSVPKIEVKLSLAECTIEVDFSIVDRIASLLNKQTVIQKCYEEFSHNLPPSHLDNQMVFNKLFDDDCSKLETKINFSLICPSVTVKLFVPIPDLRPLADMGRVPWWKRNVRKEIILLTVEDVQLEIVSSPSVKCVTFELRCNDMHIMMQHSEDSTPLSLARAMINNGTEKGFDPIRIVCEIYPAAPLTNLEDVPTKETLISKSMMGFLEGVGSSSASLFGKRKVASQQNDKLTELTIPANKDEINKFIDSTLQNIKIKFDINLPYVQFMLPSKHVYEILYNRIMADLLLWEPSSPSHLTKPKTNFSDINDALNFEQISTFKLCNFYQSDNDYADEPTSNFSTLQDVTMHRNGMDETVDGQTWVSVSLSIGNAVGCLKTPYRDNNGKIVPDRTREVMVTTKDCLIFSAVGYKGCKDACSTCIVANEFLIHHKPTDSGLVTSSVLTREFPLSTAKMNAVLYPSDFLNKMEGSVQPDDANLDALVLCFESIFDPLKNEKVFVCAGGLNKLTLRHYMYAPYEHWISQITDMFNVEDYPVQGYVLPDVVTELHFHFQHCSIDYRPLHLPVRAVLTIDLLSISSNLTLLGDSSVLLIFIEDAGLFLSQDLTMKKVFLRDKYICVANIGVLEICMKVPFDTGGNVGQEFSVSNDIIHIRTCTDSCKLFLELLIYLASEGDLTKEAENSMPGAEGLHGSVILQPSECKETVHPGLSSDQSMVENMMKEAMLDIFPDRRFHSSSNQNANCDIKSDVEMFLFPEEDMRSKVKGSSEGVCTPHVLHESFVPDTEDALREAQLDFVDKEFCSFGRDTDDDFCILDKIPGSGIKSPSGKPKYISLLESYLSVNEHYFDLSSKRQNCDHDVPKAVMKYTIHDLSIIWHMYGGHDFKAYTPIGSNKNDNHKSIQRNCVKKNTTVSFSSGEATIFSTEVIAPPGASPLLARQSTTAAKWYTAGGADRCSDILMELQLTKIKCKYEIFPVDSKFVSRHGLTINDIEIRDRLATSKINKFMYQFSSESCPRQAKANMVHIKAITTRTVSPETKLSISLRPVRLNIDQDALIFLVQFFGSLLSIDKLSEYAEEELPSIPKPYFEAPVMTLNQGNSSTNVTTEMSELREKPPVYFKSFVFSPDVPIKIDYHGKHVDMNSEYGPLAGLVIGIGQLNHSEITLKRIEFLNGVLGVHKLISSVTNEWLNDIRKNQLPSILGGVGPMHSFVKLFGGLKDLLWLPIEQYNKDGRVFRGIQRGTSSFTSSSAHAVLDLSGRLVSCIQAAAETMYDMVSSGPSVRNRAYKMRHRQPQDIREGVTTAFGLVRHGLGDTANTIWRVAAEEHSHKGVSGAVGGVLRQIPPSMVQPIILASEATYTVIGGMTNQLVPNARKEAADKWK